MKKIVFHRDAKRETQEAYKWYEERAVGLGAKFIQALDRTLLKISENPEGFHPIRNPIRQALLKRFPYSLKEEPDSIVVIAVFHQSRDPETWKSRG